MAKRTPEGVAGVRPLGRALAAVPPAILFLYAIDTLLICAFLANRLFHFDAILGTDRQIGMFDHFVSQALDLEGEGWLPTWYSSMQLLVAAQLLAIVVAGRAKIADRSSWALWALPVVFLLMSYDEIGQMHEFAGYLSDRLIPGGSRQAVGFGYSGLWGLFIALPAVAGMLSLTLALRHHFNDCAPALQKFCAGFAVIFAGAAVCDWLANFAVGTRWMLLEIAAEEYLEMIGVTTIVWASWDMLHDHPVRNALVRAFCAERRRVTFPR